MERKIKVLLADTNMETVHVFRNYLVARKDMELVAVASSGDQVIQLITEKKPDVIVMDLILPGSHDGLGALEYLRQMKLVNKPDVIVTTALGMSSTIECACQMGASYYILKPYVCEYVCERIQQLMLYRDYSSYSNYAEDAQERAGIIKENQMHSLKAEVTDIIREIGIPAHIKGYQYIREGILMAVNDPNMLNYITKFLYPTVAKKYNTTSSSVERAIRHAIGVAYTKGNMSVLKDKCGYHFSKEKKRPTNSEFLALIVDKLRMDYQLNA